MPQFGLPRCVLHNGHATPLMTWKCVMFLFSSKPAPSLTATVAVFSNANLDHPNSAIEDFVAAFSTLTMTCQRKTFTWSAPTLGGFIAHKPSATEANFADVRQEPTSSTASWRISWDWHNNHDDFWLLRIVSLSCSLASCAEHQQPPVMRTHGKRHWHDDLASRSWPQAASQRWRAFSSTSETCGPRPRVWRRSSSATGWRIRQNFAFVCAVVVPFGFYVSVVEVFFEFFNIIIGKFVVFFLETRWLRKPDCARSLYFTQQIQKKSKTKNFSHPREHYVPLCGSSWRQCRSVSGNSEIQKVVRLEGWCFCSEEYFTKKIKEMGNSETEQWKTTVWRRCMSFARKETVRFWAPQRCLWFIWW